MGPPRSPAGAVPLVQSERKNQGPKALQCRLLEAPTRWTMRSGRTSRPDPVGPASTARPRDRTSRQRQYSPTSCVMGITLIQGTYAMVQDHTKSNAQCVPRSPRTCLCACELEEQLLLAQHHKLATGFRFQRFLLLLMLSFSASLSEYFWRSPSL